MALLSGGQVLVGVTGTPVRATSNMAVPGQRLGVQSFMLQALPANAGIVYVFLAGDGYTADARATGLGCIGILPKPASATTGPFASVSVSIPVAAAGLNLADIWINGAAADGVIISATQG